MYFWWVLPTWICIQESRLGFKKAFTTNGSDFISMLQTVCYVIPIPRGWEWLPEAWRTWSNKHWRTIVVMLCHADTLQSQSVQAMFGESAAFKQVKLCKTCWSTNFFVREFPQNIAQIPTSVEWSILWQFHGKHNILSFCGCSPSPRLG